MKTLAALIVNIAIAFGSTAMAQNTWALFPDDAACLVENLDNYIAAYDEPIIIVTQACPIVDRMEALRSLQQNSGAQPRVSVTADIGDQPQVSVTDSLYPVDQIIVYTHSELKCLRELRLEMSTVPVLLPQNPCD